MIMQKRDYPLVLSILCLFFILNACADPIVRTQNVYVPIKCDIPMPSKKPIPTTLTQIDLAIYLVKSNIIYTKQLESALKFCIGVKDGK